MTELWWELSRCMTRAGLQSERGPGNELLSRSQRCSQGPVEEDWVVIGGTCRADNPSQEGDGPSLGEGVG